MSNTEVIQGRRRVIRPKGEIDFSNVGDFDAALDAAVADTPRGFVIDLSEVTYFDSAGMRSILHAFQRVHDVDGSLVLVVNTDNVRALIEALHLERAPGLEICESVDAAEEVLANRDKAHL